MSEKNELTSVLLETINGPVRKMTADAIMDLRNLVPDAEEDIRADLKKCYDDVLYTAPEAFDRPIEECLRILRAIDVDDDEHTPEWVFQLRDRWGLYCVESDNLVREALLGSLNNG